MKKAIAIGLLSTSLLAGEYTRADRVADMQVMAEAMAEIENGFFFNNKEQVVNGALKLSDAIRRVRPPLEDKEEKDPLMRYVNEKVRFSDKVVKKIDRKAEMIIERFKEGDINQALQAYKKIMNSCMECHEKIRKW